MIKTIIFDLDNTLTHRNKSIERFCHDFIEKYESQLEDFPTTYLYELITPIDNNGYGSPSNTHKKIKLSVATALSEQLDWKCRPDFDELLNYWVTHFSKCSVEMEGAGRVLSYLKGKGYKLGLISNGAEFSRLATIKALGFEGYFDAVFCSGAVGVKKPDSRIFHLSANELSTPVEECCYVGDHFINDYEGARRSGMQAFWLEGFYSLGEEQNRPEFTLKSLNDLIQHF